MYQSVYVKGLIFFFTLNPKYLYIQALANRCLNNAKTT